MSKLKYYGIEWQDQLTNNECRYYSLYNGARGAWHDSEERAIEEGEAHKALVILDLGIID